MKKLISISAKLLSAFLLAALIFSVCSCGQADVTGLMNEGQRADWLRDTSDKLFNEQKYHLDYEIILTYFDGNETFTYNVVYEELYDETDPSDIKFIRRESKNDFYGVGKEATYIGGYMYLTSGDTKIRTRMESADEAFSYLGFYSVYSEDDVPIELSCPPMKDGKYVLTQTVTNPNQMKELYDNLFWAVPEEVYGMLKIDSYKDETVYDSSGRFLETRYWIEICDPDFKVPNTVSISYKEAAHYDDFEITVPKQLQDYHFINDYYAVCDAQGAISRFFYEQNGTFEYKYDLCLAYDQGVYNCHESNRASYSTSQSGDLTFDINSEYWDNSEVSDTISTTYDGHKLTIETTGTVKETPMTQDEAFLYLGQYKNYLRLNDSAFKIVNQYTQETGGVRRVRFSMTEDFISALFKTELEYFYGLVPDEGSMNASADCEIDILYNRNGGTVDDIRLEGQATFKIDGKTATLTYIYLLNVIEHEK